MGKFREAFRHTWRDRPAKTKAKILVTVCGLVGLIVWFWPSRVDQVVRYDGAGEWQRDTAPPRRLIVWQPAETLPLPSAPQQTQSISPALTDGGATLYFSRRENGGSAAIVRTRFQDGNWQTPQPVVELNSPADDMGPIISRDGKELYLFSNRAGGQGGYDLYVSTRKNNRWSKPENLGPQINTPANEYDPCLDPTGRVIYFSSNRTAQMAQRRSQDQSDTDKEWTGTLRAETGERTYDLYRIGRDAENENWSEAEPLVALNLPESHEGAPYFSPDGAFLYFASDRPWRSEEDKNLDLYRVRLVEGAISGEAENLGPSINTPAHETEPSLSPEGFRLVFSSNREGFDQLYVSTATEVYEKTTRDTSRLQALGNPWLWAAVVCLTLLIAALFLVISNRKRLAEKVWPARFLAASLLINTIFILLLFLWKLPGIVDAIVEHFEEPTPSSRVVDAQELESQRTRENVYNKVADLPPVESTPAEWPSESRPMPTTTPSPQPAVLPEDNSLPLAENLPAHVPTTIVAVRPQPRVKRSNPKQLTRSQPTRASILTVKETSPELAKSESEPLESLPSSPSPVLEKVPTELAAPAVPQVQVNSVSIASSVPKAVLSSVADAPPPRLTSDVATKQPTRQSLREPELKQIANLDETALKTIGKREEEQLLPAEPLPLDRKSLAVQTNVDLPGEENTVPPSSPLKTIAKIAELERPSFNRITLMKPLSPDGLKKLPAPGQLAKVAELDVPPELMVSETPTQTGENESELTEKTSPPPPKRTFAETSKIPNLPKAETRPKALAKSIPIGKLPDRSQPRLQRMALKPPSALADLSQPVEVQEMAEMSAMLSLRNPETRKEMAAVFGNHPAEETAVKRGLLWLAQHQNEDGSWSLHEFHKNCKKHNGKCSGAGSERSNTAGTGLALLPFLASGYVPESKEYGSVVTKGLEWLLTNQQKDGRIQGQGDRQVMYSHGIATIALCEAYAMTKEPRLGDAAKKAVDFIVKAQHPKSGGWRYNPNEPGDTSVVGWQVMALKSAEMAGIRVPNSTYQNVRRWLASVEGSQPTGGVFGYTNKSPTPAMTAEGLLCLEFLAEPRTSPRLNNGADYLLKYLPRKDQRHTSYYWYYATQVLYHLQNEGWTTWNESLRKLLVDGQEKSGVAKGTWAPKDQWEKRGGRIYTTALKLLMLEIEYRHLPLYGGLQPIIEP